MLAHDRLATALAARIVPVSLMLIGGYACTGR